MATLDWYGCATFRLTVGSTVIWLDAYLDRVAGAPGAGITPDDVDRADWIVVGHSHFDHLAGAEKIALRTGATIVGSYETARIMAGLGVPAAQLIPVSGGERVRLADDVVVRVYPSLHSCVWSSTLPMAQSDTVCLGDTGLTWQEQQARFRSLVGAGSLAPGVLDHILGMSQGERGDGGALVYVFETPEGTLLYQDTSGHWSRMLEGLRPDVAIIAAAGRGNVDGEPIQGRLADFVAQSAALLQPRQVVLSHHDDWLPGFSVPTDVAPIRAALGATPLVELGYASGHPLFG